MFDIADYCTEAWEMEYKALEEYFLDTSDEDIISGNFLLEEDNEEMPF